MWNYCFVNNQTAEVLDVRKGIDATRASLEAREEKDNIFVQPIMLKSEYQRLHTDFKGEIDGRPFVLYLDLNGATVYGPLVLLDYWGKWCALEHHTPLSTE